MCKVCDHPKRKNIDAAIISGTRNSTIFHEWVNSGNEESWIQAFKDHKRNGHIAKTITKAVESVETKNGLDLQACAKEIYDLCLSGAKKAEKQDLRALGSCLGPAVKVLELLNTGKPDGDDKPGIDRAMERMKNDRDTRRANL